MSDNEKNTETDETPDTTDGVHNEPRGNPEVDQEALEKGVDQLERVKPY